MPGCPAQWEACLAGTRPHLVIAAESQMLYRSSRGGQAGAGCCGAVGRPHCPCPAPSLVCRVGLSSGSPRLPPVGLASLCEVPPGQAPACLVAPYPPLCSPHLVACCPARACHCPQGSILNTQAIHPHLARGVTATPTPRLAGTALPSDPLSCCPLGPVMSPPATRGRKPGAWCSCGCISSRLPSLFPHLFLQAPQVGFESREHGGLASALRFPPAESLARAARGARAGRGMGASGLPSRGWLSWVWPESGGGRARRRARQETKGL